MQKITVNLFVALWGKRNQVVTHTSSAVHLEIQFIYIEVSHFSIYMYMLEPPVCIYCTLVAPQKCTCVKIR